MLPHAKPATANALCSLIVTVLVRIQKEGMTGCRECCKTNVGYCKGVEVLCLKWKERGWRWEEVATREGNAKDISAQTKFPLRMMKGFDCCPVTGK